MQHENFKGLITSGVLKLLTRVMTFKTIQRLALLLPIVISACASTRSIDETGVIPIDSAPINREQKITRIAFGSCNSTEKDQSIFDRIVDDNPEIFLFIGDNVYAPQVLSDELSGLKSAYQSLSESKPFERLRSKMPVLATWDDHDYGPNDAGGDWPNKYLSQKIFKEVWVTSKDDDRLTHDGVYHSWTIGPEGQRIQFILLDTRFFRSPLQLNTSKSSHRYGQLSSNDATMLGNDQWQWLEAQLQEDADLRIIASSIQVLADGHGYEAWRTLPLERQRLFDLIQGSTNQNTILISGDRHLAAIYRSKEVVNPIWEITSSSLNVPIRNSMPAFKPEPGPFRQGEPFYGANYGIIEVDWPEGFVILQIRDNDGRVVRAASLKLESMIGEVNNHPEDHSQD